MKVLHLTGECEDRGGVLSVIRHLQQATLAQGLSHAVWVNKSFTEARQPSLVYRFSPHALADSSNHFRILLDAGRGFMELRRLLSQEDFHVLHAHTRGTFLIGLLIARFLQRPVLFTNHNFASRTGLYRWGSTEPNFFTVLLTPNMAKHYRLLSDPPKVNIISACCADSMFGESVVTRNALSNRKSPLRLAGMGSIVRWKNWHLLLETLFQMTKYNDGPPVQFLHWGPTLSDGNSQRYENELRQFVRERHLEGCVFFNGPTASVSDCLRRADWFVLPSTNEPCSVALIEALALGLPALVSRSGGNVDIVKPERTGLFFEPESLPDLVAKLQRILQGGLDLLRPEDIRESVRHRSASRVATEYISLYQMLRQPGFNQALVAGNALERLDR